MDKMPGCSVPFSIKLEDQIGAESKKEDSSNSNNNNNNNINEKILLSSIIIEEKKDRIDHSAMTIHSSNLNLDLNSVQASHCKTTRHNNNMIDRNPRRIELMKKRIKGEQAIANLNGWKKLKYS